MLYLVRHAESAPAPEIAEPDWPLSERGVAQARALIPQLRRLGVTRIVSSPYRRAVDTVAPFANAENLSITIDPELRERRLSDRAIGNFRALVERSWADFSFCTDTGETMHACQERVLRAVAKWTRDPGDVVLISSHGNAIGVYLNAIDPGFGFPQWRAMRNPDLFKIERQGDRAAWRRVAD